MSTRSYSLSRHDAAHLWLYSATQIISTPTPTGIANPSDSDTDPMDTTNGSPGFAVTRVQVAVAGALSILSVLLI